MNEEQRHALASVQFSSVLGPDEIWSPLTNHVDGLHPRAADEITCAVRAAARRPDTTPTGLVLSGEKGVGKTHMLGWLRQHVQEQGGAFFMPKLIDGTSFWAGAVHGVVNRLLGADGGQLGRMLSDLAELAGCSGELRMRLRGNLDVRPADIDELLERLEDIDLRAAQECRDTLRALVLYRGRSARREIGYSYLVLEQGIDADAQREWGFRTRTKLPQLLFGELVRLFALTGPVVLAVDQIDSVIAQSGQGLGDGLVDRLADGLMRMREETVRTLVVAACIPKSWELISARAVNSAADRFTVLELATAMPDATVATAIVERHLGGLYGEIGFVPPYPTWPVLPIAFEDREVAAFTPRRLLRRLEQHVRYCLAQDEVVELRHLGPVREDEAPVAVGITPEVSAGLDERFRRLRQHVDVTEPLDPQREDERMYALLNAALQAYVLERNASDLNVDPGAVVRPALHARLRRTLDEAREAEEHWSFRAISHPHPRSVLTRLRSARLEAGIQAGDSTRHLVVLRNTPFSGGPVTTAAVAEFTAAGGLALPIEAEDLRTFAALETLFAESPPGLLGWLAHRRPASRSELFTRVFGNAAVPVAADEHLGVPADGDAAPVAPPPPLTAHPAARSATVGPDATPPAPAPDDVPAVRLGRNVETGLELRVPLVALRKHTAVFAGSGSGKTVLLRRLVEEAALHGVSSILIDSNNDLARLGDRWPAARPDTWLPDDPARAERYFADTEVVVWTPRREAGRPLALDPLPDFRGVLDDPDEFRTSIDASVAGLAPRAGLTSRRAATGTAVLTEALTYFARGGGNDLGTFVDLLSDLPDGVSRIRDAVRLAQGMAEELKAAMINDPVFGGAGARLDPGTLLTPVPGARARISVISCIGLPTDEQRQTFVNQLQLALFAWIKRNPAGDRPLGGLLVLDEAQTFVPSRGTTASTESTLKLAAQARKYGLGMVYATQAPKGLHNMVSGNAATQFFGLLNAPAQIQAATELARAKGGRVDDISRLRAGRFYAAVEGSGFAKITVPMCLSHHPPSALTEEEVLDRARDERRSGGNS
ncbi:ATP-binding protein [Nocardia farcinica]|uniref:ATP-binding protein n=1 Tax=Nocardia farcinica TaxID=37329 RepID=UPI0022BA0D02|nr:DUF87 domain-containing protein [Nocardia farcinica]MCZ9327258.1 DUF87 domain-containing protein [Nocardia farcinica]